MNPLSKILFTTFLVCECVLVSAQAPQGFYYQAIARDSSGTTMMTTTFQIRFSIVEGIAQVEIYKETQSVTTNQFGLFTAVVGSGTPVTGNFANINWGTNDYYLKTEADFGSGYTILGVSELVSVPYSLYAEKAGDADLHLNDLIDVNAPIASIGQVLKWDGALWSPANDSTRSTDNWGTQTALTDSSLSGDGTDSNLLKIAQRGATSGQVLKWNGSSWLPSPDHALWKQTGNNIYYNSGNVGIGTTNPLFELDVKGSARISTNDSIYYFVADSIVVDTGVTIPFVGELYENGDVTMLNGVFDLTHTGISSSTAGTFYYDRGRSDGWSLQTDYKGIGVWSSLGASYRLPLNASSIGDVPVVYPGKSQMNWYKTLINEPFSNSWLSSNTYNDWANRDTGASGAGVSNICIPCDTLRNQRATVKVGVNAFENIHLDINNQDLIVIGHRAMNNARIGKWSAVICENCLTSADSVFSSFVMCLDCFKGNDALLNNSVAIGNAIMSNGVLGENLAIIGSNILPFTLQASDISVLGANSLSGITGSARKITSLGSGNDVDPSLNNPENIVMLGHSQFATSSNLLLIGGMNYTLIKYDYDQLTLRIAPTNKIDFWNDANKTYTIDMKEDSAAMTHAHDSKAVGFSAKPFAGKDTVLFVFSEPTNSAQKLLINLSNEGVGIDARSNGNISGNALFYVDNFSIESTTGAFSPPRITAMQASAISPANGMMLYVSDTNATFPIIGFWGYENGVWVKL